VNATALRAEARRLRARKVDQMMLHTAGAIDGDDLKVGMGEIRDRLAVIEAQLATSNQPDPLVEFRGDTPAEQVWGKLTLPRKRAIVRLVADITVMPTTRRGPGFDPSAVRVRWRWDDPVVRRSLEGAPRVDLTQPGAAPALDRPGAPSN
jgi:hypothetical protein